MAKRKTQKVQAGSKPKAKKSTKKFFHQQLFQANFWKNHLIAAGILFLLGVGLYLQTYNYEFVLDDQIVITNNNYTEKGFAGIWEILTTESFQGYFQAQKDLVAGARYRPLSIVTFAIEKGLTGTNSPARSHLLNALLYGLCGLLLYRVLSLMFVSNGSRQPWYMQLGFATALLWILHPLHTEAVANIKGRDEIMAVIGSLAALYYGFKYIEKGKLWHMIYACITFFLGLLSKETTVTFLAIIPLSIYFFQSGNIQKIAKVFVPLFIVFIIYLILRIQVIGYLFSENEVTDLMNNPFVNMNGGQKYATIFYTLLLYLKLGFFPHPLTHDYYPFHIPTMEWSDFWPILSVLIYVAMGVFALSTLRKRSVISYSILFFIATLSIVSNLLFPIGTFMNERFLFMPSIGICIIIAYVCLDRLPHYFSFISKKAGIILIGIIALFYGYKSITRIPAWKSPLTLNKAAIKVSKNSARANVFTGTAYFNEYKSLSPGPEKDNAFEQANHYINKALSLYPGYHNANVMKAGIAAEQYQKDGNLDHLLKSFTEVGRYAPSIKYLHDYYNYLANRADSSKLLEFHYNLGKNILVDQEFRYNDGLRQLNYAFEIDKSNQKVIKAIAETFEKLGDSAKAQQFYNLLQ